MNAAISPDTAKKNYEDNMLAAFGYTPKVRRLESGGFSVKFEDGTYSRYTKREMLLAAGFVKEMLLDEVH